MHLQVFFATNRYFFIKIFILKLTSEATEDKLKVSPTVLQENPAVPISSLEGCNIKETWFLRIEIFDVYQSIFFNYGDGFSNVFFVSSVFQLLNCISQFRNRRLIRTLIRQSCKKPLPISSSFQFWHQWV